MPSGIDSEKSMEARSLIFLKTAKTFGKERLWVLNGSNLPPNFPKIEDYQSQNSPKSAIKVAQKLRSATSQFSDGTIDSTTN